MSLYQLNFKKQESMDNIFLFKKNKINSRKYMVANKQNSYVNNLKVSKNNILPKIYPIKKNNSNVKSNNEKENLQINDYLSSILKLKNNKLIKKLSINQNIKKSFNPINTNSNNLISQNLNDKNENENFVPNTLNKKSICVKKILKFYNISPSKYSFMNQISKYYKNENNKSILKYFNLSTNKQRFSNSKSPKTNNLNSTNKPNEEICINPYKEKNNVFINNKISIQKKTKELKNKSGILDESNSFIKDIKDIINMCSTPIKKKDEIS
jgi:hypothetical protein